MDKPDSSRFNFEKETQGGFYPIIEFLIDGEKIENIQINEIVERDQ